MENITLRNEYDQIFISLEIVLYELKNELIHIFSVLSEVRLHNFNGSAKQIKEDIKRVEESALKGQNVIKELLSALPELRKNSNTLVQQLKDVRHQLRTYINGIRGYSEFVIEALQEENAVQNCGIISTMETILVISNKMLVSIDNLEITDLSIFKQQLLGSPQSRGNKIETLPFDSSGEIANQSSIFKQVSNADLIQKMTRKMRSRSEKITGSILIVDDLEVNRSLLEAWLKNRQYTVYSADSGLQALALINEHPDIDIVLLDLMMPIMDGYEVLRRIKRDIRSENLIVIMISALNDIESITKCLSEGAEDYMVKPFNSFLLDVKIKTSLEKKRLRDTEDAFIGSFLAELNFAQQIQLSMMPTNIPVSDLFSIYGRVIPAKEIGGDFYDWHDLGNGKYSICIGDVSGKGASAALYMVQMRTILNTLETVYTHSTDDLAAFLAHANMLQCRNNDTSMFVTLFYGILDIHTGQLMYANAGHCRPFILQGNGLVKQLEGLSGLPMGVSEELTYTTFSTNLEKGSTLVLYTDGVTEAMNASGKMYSISGLDEALRECAYLSPQRVVEKVINSVVIFTDKKESLDDITLLAVHLKMS